jgi:NAD(P)-binding Rossmann-like domain
LRWCRLHVFYSRRPAPAQGDKTTETGSRENAHNGSYVMTNVQDAQRTGAKADFDAVIIGAGFSGMYMLHSLRDKLDLNATVIEAGDGVGGTWYWNRYPGARCDSDSYIYCYTFDKNLLQEWNWSESAIRSKTRSCATSNTAPSAST